MRLRLTRTTSLVLRLAMTASALVALACGGDTRVFSSDTEGGPPDSAAGGKGGTGGGDSSAPDTNGGAGGGDSSTVDVSTGGAGGTAGTGGSSGRGGTGGGDSSTVDMSTGGTAGRDSSTVDMNTGGTAGGDSSTVDTNMGGAGGAGTAGAAGGDGSVLDVLADKGGNEPDVCVFKSAEDCFNGIDDDCNGTMDCADPACGASSECVPAGNVDFQLGIVVDPPTSCPPLWTGADRPLNDGLTTSGSTCTNCSCNAQTSCSLSIYGYATATACTNDVTKTGGTLIETVTNTTCGGNALTSAGYRISNFTKTDSACTPAGTAAKPTVSWTTQKKFCTANSVGGGCSPGYVCTPKRPTVAEHCAAADGVKSCPAGYVAVGTTWYKDYQDNMQCGACTCGAQTPGDCTKEVISGTQYARNLGFWPASASTCDSSSGYGTTVSNVPGSQTCCALQCAATTCGAVGVNCAYAGFIYPPVQASCPASSTLTGAATPTNQESYCCKQ